MKHEPASPNAPRATGRKRVAVVALAALFAVPGFVCRQAAAEPIGSPMPSLEHCAGGSSAALPAPQQPADGAGAPLSTPPPERDACAFHCATVSQALLSAQSDAAPPAAAPTGLAALGPGPAAGAELAVPRAAPQRHVPPARSGCTSNTVLRL